MGMLNVPASITYVHSFVELNWEYIRERIEYEFALVYEHYRSLFFQGVAVQLLENGLDQLTSTLILDSIAKNTDHVWAALTRVEVNHLSHALINVHVHREHYFALVAIVGYRGLIEHSQLVTKIISHVQVQVHVPDPAYVSIANLGGKSKCKRKRHDLTK